MNACAANRFYPAMPESPQSLRVCPRGRPRVFFPKKGLHYTKNAHFEARSGAFGGIFYQRGPFP
jgi:hypothetical protein